MMLNLAMRFIFRSYSRVKKKMNSLLRGNSTVEFTCAGIIVSLNVCQCSFKLKPGKSIYEESKKVESLQCRVLNNK